MVTEQSNVETIFFAALEKPSPEEVVAYLDEACANDAGLRRRVEALLDARPKLGSFLQGRAADMVDTLPPPPLERPGTQIGPYKLLEQIGEGGMGVVYMADQEQPIERRVAIKIIKPGMDTRQVIARFEAERQALAVMDHVNIARVLDAGATDSGRPYFVMELVQGVPITQYCDDNHLTPRQRLELFVPVCLAIQHAHQKGIIHRDIKPTNVLVTLYDGKPVPKVIDFGVAKATEQRLTERTLFTQYGTMVGTLEYMSPEQAEMSALGVDTRSDIFSLGVLLYELLTGSTPLSHQRVKEIAYAEILRLIKEEEPPRPSTRLSDSGEALASISAQRHTEPAKLARLLRGELDWIVMKCLEKDRNRRYETATGFAADVQRYLNDEPVQAAPPSVWYRARKFARRNQAGLAVAALVLFFVVLLGSGVGWAVRDRSAQRTERVTRTTTQIELILADVDRSIQEQKWPEALIEARRAEAVLAGGESDESTAERVRELLKDFEFIERLEEIRMQQATWIRSSFDDAGADRAYAEAFRGFGVDTLALAVETSIERFKARPALAIPVAAALDNWSSARRVVSMGDADDWKRLVAVARGIDPEPLRDRVRATWGQPDSEQKTEELRQLAESIEVRMQHPATLQNLARALRRNKRSDWGLELLRNAQAAYPEDFWLNFGLAEGLAKQEDHEGAVRFYTAAVCLRPRAAAAHVNLGNALQDQGKLEEAVAAYRKAVELDPKLYHAYNNLGTAFRKQGKLDEAIAAYRTAIDIKPRDAIAHSNLGSALEAQGKPEAAIATYRTAIELDPQFAGAYNNLGTALYDQKKLDEAVATLRKAIELDPNDARGYHNLGGVLLDQRNLDEAIGLLRKAIELDPKLADTHNNLGNALQGRGNLEEAITCYATAIQLDPKLAFAHNNLGNALQDQGKLEEAIACYARAIELDPTYANAYHNLGGVLLDQRNLVEAIAALRRAIELDPEFANAYNRLGVALGQQNKVDEAVDACRKAIDLDPKNADAHSNLGAALRAQKELDEAIVVCRRAIELEPKLAAAYGNLGNALYDQKRLDEAVAVLRKAIQLEPNSALGYHNLGGVLLDQRNLVEAIAALRRAIELDPEFANAYNRLGVALREQKKLDEAIAAYRKAIELDPQVAGVHTNLGVALAGQGQLDEAVAELRRAVELKPTCANAYNRLGDALREQKKLDEAVAAYQTAVQLDPNSAIAYSNLGRLLCDDLKDYDKSIEYFMQAIELDPKDVIAYSNLGVALGHQNKLDEAIAAYRKATELDPNCARACYNLGAILCDNVKDYDGAIACFRKAIEVDPRFANAHCNLGVALTHQAKYDEAIAAYRKAIELDPKDAPAHNGLAWLLATCSDAKFRDPSRAVTLARKAVELTPDDPNIHNTLGAAYYSTGDWKATIVTLEKAMEMRQGGDGYDWIFLTMAHWQLDNKEEARQWYDKAMDWMAKENVKDELLVRFQQEAAELLKIDTK